MTTTPDFQATLLPPSATEHVRRVDRAGAPTDALWAAALRVGALKAERPAEAIPFLIWELGLEEIAPWIADPLRLIREGRAWQRIRGTPASIAQALSWAAAPIEALEEHPGAVWWDAFQLALTRPASAEELAAMEALSRLAAPAGMRLARLYQGWDWRIAVADGGARADGCFMADDWSGARRRADGPKLSFRIERRAGADVAPAAHQGVKTVTRARGLEIRRARAFQADRDRADGPPRAEPRHSFSARTLARASGALYPGPLLGYASGPWPVGGYASHGEPAPAFVGDGLRVLSAA